MTVSRKVKSVKASVLSKRAKTVKAITVKNAKGKVTYTKVSGSKYLEVNKTTGEITVKKGAPKGIYSAKVRVKAAGDSNYDSTTKTVTVKVRVK